MADKYVIGCDPDSGGNGIAVYYDGVLVELANLSAVEFYCKFENLKGHSVTFAIENVNGTKCVFRAGGAKNKGDAGAKGRGVGKCQQAQTEIEKAAELLGFEVVKLPRSNKWKKGYEAKEFEAVTNWKGRSNEDTRSAAYMGFRVI